MNRGAPRLQVARSTVHTENNGKCTRLLDTQATLAVQQPPLLKQKAPPGSTAPADAPQQPLAAPASESHAWFWPQLLPSCQQTSPPAYSFLSVVRVVPAGARSGPCRARSECSGQSGATPAPLCTESRLALPRSGVLTFAACGAIEREHRMRLDRVQPVTGFTYLR